MTLTVPSGLISTRRRGNAAVISTVVVIAVAAAFRACWESALIEKRR